MPTKLRIAKPLHDPDLYLSELPALPFNADFFAAEFARSGGAMPLPPCEEALATSSAEIVEIMAGDFHIPCGAIFSPEGDLIFCDATGGKVLRLDSAGHLRALLEIAQFPPTGLAWHPDGRLFVAGHDEESGGVISICLKTGERRIIIEPYAGFMPHDLIFNSRGGFHFTDFKGSAASPLGGVYYMAPDLHKMVPVIPGLARAAGVALSPNGKALWATEYAANRLHRAGLAAGNSRIDARILYYFTGPSPDTTRVDAAGNVYVALAGQGRVLIFNPAAIPIGQILLPGREDGANLLSTSLALHPAKPEMLITAGNEPGSISKDAAIFRAPAFANALGRPAGQVK